MFCQSVPDRQGMFYAIHFLFCHSLNRKQRSVQEVKLVTGTGAMKNSVLCKK